MSAPRVERAAGGVEISVGAGFIELALVVVPGASRTRVIGAHGTALRVAVSAAPERGKANDAVCELLAQFLGVRSADVDIVSGHSGRSKRARVSGLTASAAIARLDQAGR